MRYNLLTLSGVTSAVFLISTYLGFVWADQNPSLAKSVLDEFSAGFDFIKELPHYVIFSFILANNSIKSLVSMVLGVLFGIAPIVFIAINGFVIGVVLNVKGAEIGFYNVLVMLLPHGIIEIPAVLIACTYGLWLGLKTFDRVRGKDVNISQCLKKALMVYLKVVLPMLLIAAFVETYITPIIALLSGSIPLD